LIQAAAVVGALFVPSATAATNGTIHAWGTVGGTPRYVTYAVGSASISALATAIGSLGGTSTQNKENSIYPAPLTQVRLPAQSYYISSENEIVVYGSQNAFIFDRSFSTCLYSSPRSISFSPPVINIDSGAVDFTTRFVTNGSVWSKFGGFDGMFHPMGSGLYMPSSSSYGATLAGSGSATHLFSGYLTTGGTSFSLQMSGLASVTLGTSASPRLITIMTPDHDTAPVISVDAAGGHGIQYAGTAATLQTSFVAGTGQVTVTLRQKLLVNEATYEVPQGNLVQGGTGVVRAVQEALSSLS
jgi:hypothetical protein